jgi:hypothetical protein
MNEPPLNGLFILLVAIFLGMLATVLLPIAYKFLGIALTLATVMVLLTRR